jgi:hypothetical protein
MGHQQVLLILLGVIVIGIAIVVGVHLFTAQAASSNLDSMVSDLQTLRARAHEYYRKPVPMGGGSRSFVGLTADAVGIGRLTSQATNDNGTYSIAVSGTDTEVVLQGDGLEDGDGDGVKVQVKIWVRADVENDSLALVNW